MVSSLAEVKYLESDDFDQAIRVQIARLVTRSVRIVARCGSRSACMQRKDAIFRLLFANSRQASIRDRLLFATGLYSRQAFIRDTTVGTEERKQNSYNSAMV